MIAARAFAARLAARWLPIAVLLIASPVLADDSFASQVREASKAGDSAQVARATAEAERQWRDAPSLENTNDLALAWILAGRAAEGIQLLRDLEKREPDSAIVAAHLGTALELAGSDQEALLWIRESVRRDPKEHEGSEWVHVKILEARLALARNPNWLRTHSVVGWREGQSLLADERGLVRSPRDLVEPIKYQLERHTRFFDPPDAIAGNLFLTLGDIAHSYPGAYANAWERDADEYAHYQQALRYGTVHEVRVRNRLEDAKERIEASRPEREAAARRKQQAEAQAAQQAEKRAERQREEEQRRIERRQEQVRRRQLALWVFVSLGVVVAAALLWRRKQRAG